MCWYINMFIWHDCKFINIHMCFQRNNVLFCLRAHTSTPLKLSILAQIQSPLHLRSSTHTHCYRSHLQESFPFDVGCETIDPGGRPNILKYEYKFASYVICVLLITANKIKPNCSIYVILIS